MIEKNYDMLLSLLWMTPSKAFHMSHNHTKKSKSIMAHQHFSCKHQCLCFDALMHSFLHQRNCWYRYYVPSPVLPLRVKWHPLSRLYYTWANILSHSSLVKLPNEVVWHLLKKPFCLAGSLSTNWVHCPRESRTFPHFNVPSLSFQ